MYKRQLEDAAHGPRPTPVSSERASDDGDVATASHEQQKAAEQTPHVMTSYEAWRETLAGHGPPRLVEARSQELLMGSYLCGNRRGGHLDELEQLPEHLQARSPSSEPSS